MIRASKQDQGGDSDVNVRVTFAGLAFPNKMSQEFMSTAPEMYTIDKTGEVKI